MTASSRREILTLAAATLLAGAPALAKPSRPAAKSSSTAGLVEPAMRLKFRAPQTPTVALTLDACPGGFDVRVADALVRGSVPATWFVTGAWMREHPEGFAFLRAHPDLFAIENHGERHVPAVIQARRIFGINTAGGLDAVRREVMLGAGDIEQQSGLRPRWYRDATGLYSPQALTAIEDLGFAVAGYSVNADEGASLPQHQVAARIRAASDGDVIIAHGNQPARSSGQGVVEGVMDLRERGFRFVRLDRLGRADVTYANWPAEIPSIVADMADPGSPVQTQAQVQLQPFPARRRRPRSAS